MKDIRMLNDNELEMVNGGSIESSNIVGYQYCDLPYNVQGYNLNRQHEEYEDR